MDILASFLIKGVFQQANFSDLTNVFVSVILFLLNLVLRFSFAFLASKGENYCDEACSCFGRYLRHVTLQMVTYLLKVHFEFFFIKRLNTIDKTWFFIIIFLLYHKQEKLGTHIFPKIVSISKTCPAKVTSARFLFREVEY